LHFEVTAFLTAAIGLLGLISFCLLVFGRLGVGSIIAFLVAGVLIELVRDIPTSTVLALRGVAELGVVLLLFLIGLEIRLDELRRLGRDVLAFGLPQIVLSALVIGLYVWWRFAGWEASLVLGLGFALSSTVVVVPLLRDRDELHSPWGTKAFAILLAQDTVEPVKSTLLALFFLSVGLSVDLRIVSLTWAPLLLNAVAILVMKSTVVLGLALVLGVTRVDALRLALALAQCGEFGFVLFGAAQVGGLMTAERVGLASVLITISMLATPFLVRLGDRLQPSE